MAWFPPVTVVVLAWGALAFGAEYPWAYAPLLVLCATVGGLALVIAGAGDAVPRAVLLALIAVFVCGALQVVPLPERLLSVVSPARFEHDYHALWATAMPRPVTEVAGNLGEASSISIGASRTILGLAFLAGFGVFFVGCTRGLAVAGPVGIARGLVALGTVVAVVGVIQQASGSDLVYGVWPPRKDMRPSAPFINWNHLAGWMVMTLSLAIGYLGGLVARGTRRIRNDWRSRVLWLSSREANEIGLVGLAVTVMALSLLVTLSRSGIVALLSALVVSGWWAARRQVGGLRRAAVPVGLFVAAAVAAGWAGLDTVGEEFSRTSWSDLGGRMGIWRDTLRIVRDFPLTGTGLNTYGIAMLGYQTYLPDMRWVEAHNDYLQLVAEGGLLLAVPSAVVLLVVARTVLRRFREGRDDAMVYWVRVGAVTGMMAIGLQSVVDFSLQMPGNTALFALLLAIAVHRRGSTRPLAPELTLSGHSGLA